MKKLIASILTFIAPYIHAAVLPVVASPWTTTTNALVAGAALGVQNVTNGLFVTTNRASAVGQVPTWATTGIVWQAQASVTDPFPGTNIGVTKIGGSNMVSVIPGSFDLNGSANSVGLNLTNYFKNIAITNNAVSDYSMSGNWTFNGGITGGTIGGIGGILDIYPDNHGSPGMGQTITPNDTTFTDAGGTVVIGNGGGVTASGGFIGSGSALTGITASQVPGVITNGWSGPLSDKYGNNLTVTNLHVTTQFTADADPITAFPGVRTDGSGTLSASNFTLLGSGTYTGNGSGLTNLATYPFPTPYAWWSGQSVSKLSDGTALTVIPDLSGNGRNLTGAGCAIAATDITPGPAYYFNGISGMTNQGFWTTALNTNFSVFMVWKDPIGPYTNNSKIAYVWSANGPSNQTAAFFQSYNSAVGLQNGQSQWTSITNTTFASFTDALPLQGAGYINNSTLVYQGFNLQQYMNGWQCTLNTLINPHPGGFMFSSPGDFGLGGNISAIGSFGGFTGYVYEMLIFTNVLSRVQITQINNYLNSKYLPQSPTYVLEGDSETKGYLALVNSNLAIQVSSFLGRQWNVVCTAMQGMQASDALNNYNSTVLPQHVTPLIIRELTGFNDFTLTTCETNILLHALSCRSNNIPFFICTLFSTAIETNGLTLSGNYYGLNTWIIANSNLFDYIIRYDLNTNWGVPGSFTNHPQYYASDSAHLTGDAYRQMAIIDNTAIQSYLARGLLTNSQNYIGTFAGNGSGLTNISLAGVAGLNTNQIFFTNSLLPSTQITGTITNASTVTNTLIANVMTGTAPTNTVAAILSTAITGNAATASTATTVSNGAPLNVSNATGTLPGTVLPPRTLVVVVTNSLVLPALTTSNTVYQCSSNAAMLVTLPAPLPGYMISIQQQGTNTITETNAGVNGFLVALPWPGIGLMPTNSAFLDFHANNAHTWICANQNGTNYWEMIGHNRSGASVIDSAIYAVTNAATGVGQYPVSTNSGSGLQWSANINAGNLNGTAPLNILPSAVVTNNTFVAFSDSSSGSFGSVTATNQSTFNTGISVGQNSGANLSGFSQVTIGGSGGGFIEFQRTNPITTVGAGIGGLTFFNGTNSRVAEVQGEADGSLNSGRFEVTVKNAGTMIEGLIIDHSAFAYIYNTLFVKGIQSTNAVTVLSGAQFNGSGAGLTNLPPAALSVTVSNAIIVSGQLYTNNTGAPLMVSANVVNNAVGVLGVVGTTLNIQSPFGITNYATIGTTLTSIAMSYTNGLSGIVPTNAIWYYTNATTGAGNSSTLFGGQQVNF